MSTTIRVIDTGLGRARCGSGRNMRVALSQYKVRAP
jgi:hypothetical protein